jgi:hypothetical protein
VEESDKQDKTTDIFAAGNEQSDMVVIPPEALDEVFGATVITRRSFFPLSSSWRIGTFPLRRFIS